MEPLDNTWPRAWADDPTDPAARARRWAGWLLVAGMVALVCVLTEKLLLAVTLPYLFAAYPSLRSGFWIAKHDPVGSRKWVCFTFYLAAACWKAAAAALLTVFTMMVLARDFGRAPNMDRFAITMLTLLGGVILNTMIGMVATLAALRSRVRVWVHPNIMRASGQNFSRISLPRRYYGFNHAIFVVATSIMFPMLVVASVLAATVFTVKGPNDVDWRQMTVIFGLFFGGPIALFPLYGWLSRRIIARSPSECWPVD